MSSLYLTTYVNHEKQSVRFHLSLNPKEKSETLSLPLRLEQINTTQNFDDCLKRYKQIINFLQDHEHIPSTSAWFWIGSVGPSRLADAVKNLNSKPIRPPPQKANTGVYLANRDKYFYN